MTSKSSEFRFRHVLLGRDCLAIVLVEDGDGRRKELDAVTVFKDFVKQNSVCFWNQCLVQSVNNLEFRGWLVPATVFIGGNDFALEVVRSAWARRVLRPPKGYTISKLGDIPILELHPVPQTQFAPLSEALCKVVIELNSENMPATAASVSAKLQNFFPKMEVPNDEILYKTLGGLIRERKLYHTGEGYFVVSPDTYRQKALPPLCERQMLMTNEEAIVRLHGDQRERSMAVQVNESDVMASLNCSSSLGSTMETSNSYSSQHASPIHNSTLPGTDLRVTDGNHSINVVRVKEKATATREIFGRYSSFKDHANKKEAFANSNENDLPERQRYEKQSMLSRLLRRMQSLAEKSNKQGTFTAQYPPLEWFGSEQLHCHSVATQTQLQFRKIQSQSNEIQSHHMEPASVKMTWLQANSGNTDKTQCISKPLTKGYPLESETHYVHKKSNLSHRPAASKYSPSHRYSYAAFNHNAKRHHYKHRRSSSESPKIDKTKRNETDVLHDYRVDNLQNSLGNRASNPKAIINPCSIVYKQSVPINLPLNFSSSANTASTPLTNTSTPLPSTNKTKFTTPITDSSNDVVINFPKSVSLVTAANGFNRTPKRRTEFPAVATMFRDLPSRPNSISNSELKMSTSESNSETPIPVEDTKHRTSKSAESKENRDRQESPKIVNDSTALKPSSTKEIVIDNSVNVEIAVEKKLPKIKSNNVSTTVSQTVTEETTLKHCNGKIVTVTSVTTSLTHGSAKDGEKRCQETKLASVDKDMEKEEVSEINNLNLESKNSPCVIDCSSSCNIVTEVK